MAGLTVTLLIPSSGCQAPERDRPGEQRLDAGLALPRPSTTVLRDALERFVEFAESRVADAAERIERETTDREVRRAALIWKLELLPDMQADLQDKEPLEMLLDSWALWVRLSQYLQAGEGQDLFGPQQPLAVAATAGILQAVEALAREHLPAKEQEAIVRRINVYAREHPIRGVFAHESVADFAQVEEGRNTIQRLLGAPLRAMGRVGEGLDPTLSLSRSVDRLTELMSDYPALVRWQAQLLLLEVERLGSVQTTVSSAQTLSQASDRLAGVAEDLPERLREETERLFADVDERQPELQKTLTELRATVQTVNEALTQAQETSAAVQSVLGELRGLRGPPATTRPGAQPASAPATSFDIKEYTRTAETLKAATTELRALVADIRGFLDDGTLDRRGADARALTNDLLDQTDSRLRHVIDHAFWRAVQFALLLLVVGGVYRIIGARFSRVAKK
jgi:hypothetical protein